MLWHQDAIIQRVQFDFSEETFEKLEALRAKLRMSTRAEVVRAALGLLRWSTDYLEQGGLIKVAEWLAGLFAIILAYSSTAFNTFQQYIFVIA